MVETAKWDIGEWDNSYWDVLLGEPASGKRMMPTPPADVFFLKRLKTILKRELET